MASPQHHILPSTTLTPKQCNQIMWPVLRVALPMSKIQRRFPCTILHSPISNMGLGLSSLYLTQLYSHSHHNSSSLWPHQLNHGPTPLCQHGNTTLRVRYRLFPTQSPLAHMGPSSNPHMAHLHLAIPGGARTQHHLHHYFPSPTPRIRHPLMDYLVPRISNAVTLCSLNHCHMHLRIFWLSEVLTTNHGSQVDPSILHGQPTIHSLCKWPPQDTPTPSDWLLWHSNLLTHLCHIPIRPSSSLLSTQSLHPSLVRPLPYSPQLASFVTSVY